MWRERLDVFWNGKSLALGAFDAGRIDAFVGAPELAVLSASDASLADAALLDLIDPVRWRRAGACIVDIPRGHGFVALRASDGTELRLALIDDEAAGGGAGEWRLLLTELAANPSQAQPAFRVAYLSARGDLERITREEVANSGARLVWAISQRRQFSAAPAHAESDQALLRLWPAQLVFPAQQSRLLIEAGEVQTHRRLAPLKAPFAIMEHWLSECGAPVASLRLRFPSLDQGEPFLARAAVVLVMHQRRRARLRNRGGPVVDALTVADIRQATGSPREQPDAALSGAPIVVLNLLQLLTRGGSPAAGVSARRRQNGGSDASVVADVDFFGAALGDDVGLVCIGADAGDFGVLPEDPGGVRYARLFRFESDALRPFKLKDEDPLLDEILRIAAQSENGAAGGGAFGGERALSAQARRERLVAEFNGALALAVFQGRFDAARVWDILEPLAMIGFLSLVEGAEPATKTYLARVGGYDAFRADPSLLQALARQGETPRGLDETELRKRRLEQPSLVYRFLQLCGLSGLLPAAADADLQIAAWRLLTSPSPSGFGAGASATSLAHRLAVARIALEAAPNIAGVASHAAEALADEGIVDRAAIYCEEAGRQLEGDALRGYLNRRRAGEWIPLSHAEALAAVVEEADAYWREIDATRGRAAADEPTAPRQAGLFSAVRSFFRATARGRRDRTLKSA